MSYYGTPFVFLCGYQTKIIDIMAKYPVHKKDSMARTAEQWAKEGFFPTMDAKGVTEWVNRFCEQTAVYYEPSEVYHSDLAHLIWQREKYIKNAVKRNTQKLSYLYEKAETLGFGNDVVNDAEFKEWHDTLDKFCELYTQRTANNTHVYNAIINKKDCERPFLYAIINAYLLGIKRRRHTWKEDTKIKEFDAQIKAAAENSNDPNDERFKNKIL